ncbi:MAG: DUF3575 domain-containing protein [Bacteroides sp.]|nr:DUF3575 domain-containing protein [Bacteroides sp.]
MMDNTFFKTLLVLCFIFCVPMLSAQQVALKSNLLYWGTTTPNLGVELALDKKLTLDLTGAYNPWIFGSKEGNKKLQHWLVKPELRFWPYEKWDGHFLGIQGIFASYNAGGVHIPLVPIGHLQDYRYEGYATGGGFSYGYQWYLSPHWNIEATAALGYLYLNYKQYECRKCGAYQGKSHKHWIGPTHVGVSVVYLFTSKKK